MKTTAHCTFIKYELINSSISDLFRDSDMDMMVFAVLCCMTVFLSCTIVLRCILREIHYIYKFYETDCKHQHRASRWYLDPDKCTRVV